MQKDNIRKSECKSQRKSARSEKHWQCQYSTVKKTNRTQRRPEQPPSIKMLRQIKHKPINKVEIDQNAMKKVSKGQQHRKRERPEMGTLWTSPAASQDCAAVAVRKPN